MRFFRISLFLCVPKKVVIKNENLPVCLHCIHFSPEYSKCTKFGEKNIITNEIRYNSAEYCREDENKCGEKGTYF